MVAAFTPRLEGFTRSQGADRPAQARRSSVLPSTDRGERGPIQARLPLVEQTASKTLNRIRQPAKANLSSKTVTLLSFTDLNASLTRHVLQLVPSVGPNHPSISGLDCLSSGIGILVGSAVTIGNGVADLNKSQQIGDGEGMRRAVTQIGSGAISTSASLLSLIYETTVSTLAVIGVAEDVFFGVGSVVNMTISGWAIYRSACFLSRIDGHLESINLNEKERVVKALEFLKEKIAPTEREKESIVKEIERIYPKWRLQEKITAAKRKILDLAEVKFRYVKRRTGQKTAERILTDVCKHLDRLRSPKSDLFHLASAKELISEVKNQTKKEILINAIVAITSLIAFTALIIGTFFSLGALPFVLYAISSAIALGILLYPLITENLIQFKFAAVESGAVALAPFTVITSVTTAHHK